MTDATAEEVRALRARLGWSRAELARQLGVSNHVAWRLETSGPKNDKERELLRELIGVDRQVEAELWAGLRPGSRCRLSRGPGRTTVAGYTFVRYVRTDSQEYVELKGARGETRTVRPDLVRGPRGERLVQGGG